MEKEEVKQAVVEETEVATAEAEVAEATEETTEETAATDETANADEDELSPWYYFFSQGCGWCKKSSPIVEELIDDGHDILMLDTAEPDNAKLRDELFGEYSTQCGTPWFINADTGKGICGFREKDIVQKWLAGEDIPEPPRVKGPMPKIPFMGATNKEELAWKREYDEWVKNNDHMGEDWKKGLKSSNALLKNPRPKSDPPRPPMGPALLNASDEVLENWGKDLAAWQKDNSHLPNQQNVDAIVANMKQRRDQMKSQQGIANQPTAGAAVDNTQLNTMDARVQALEVKIDKIMNHFGVK